jgi:tetratricopeptide (TPR) repeat protein
VTGSGDGTVKVWDAESGQELTTVKSGAVTSAAFSPDGLRIITSDAGQSVKVWSAATGKELLSLSAPGDHGVAGVVSPDARRIVACATDPAGKDSGPIVWKAASPEQIEAWRKEEDAGEPQRKLRALAGDLSRAISDRNWDEADLKFSEVEKLVPDEQRADLDLTHFKILIGKNDYVNACKLAEAASETRKDDAEALNDLAWDLVTSKSVEPHGLEMAEKFATRANEAASGASPNILDTLARVLFMRGKKDEAIQMQQRAVTAGDDQGKPGYQKTLESYRKGILPKLD